MLVITGGPALIGRDMELVPHACVVLRGDRIDRAGPSSDIPIPAGAETFEVGGGLIAPGFIDCHVHIGLSSPSAVLAGGVTCVRDLAWPEREIFELARGSARPGFPGPLIMAAGPMLTAPGGYPTSAAWAPPGTGVAVSGPAEAQEVVDRLAGKGACVIKVALNPDVGPVLDAPTLAAVVGEAHGRGLRVTAHISGVRELEKALLAGVDELAHMLMGYDRIPDDLLQGMVEQEMTVVGTLSIRAGEERSCAIDNSGRFLEAGGTLLYGTDLGNEGPRPGIDRGELRGMADAGMEPRAIIRAATEAAASHLGLHDRGVLEAGKAADIVILDPTGLDDPRRLSEVSGVVRDGRVVASGARS